MDWPPSHVPIPLKKPVNLVSHILAACPRCACIDFFDFLCAADMFVAEHEKHLPQYGLFTAGNISLVMDDGGCVIPESYRLGGALKNLMLLPLVEFASSKRSAWKLYDASQGHECASSPGSTSALAPPLHDVSAALLHPMSFPYLKLPMPSS